MFIPFLLFGLFFLTVAFSTEDSITFEESPAELDTQRIKIPLEIIKMNNHAIAGGGMEASNNMYKIHGIETKSPPTEENEVKSSFGKITTERDGNQTNILTYGGIGTNNLNYEISGMESSNKVSKGYGMETNKLAFAEDRTANFNPIPQASEMEGLNKASKGYGMETNMQAFAGDKIANFNPLQQVSSVETNADKATGNEADRLMFPEDEVATNYSSHKVNGMEASNNTYTINGIETRIPPAEENEVKSSFGKMTTEKDGSQTNIPTYGGIGANNLNHGISGMESLNKASKGNGMETNKLAFVEDRTANFNPIPQSSGMESLDTASEGYGMETNIQTFAEDRTANLNPTHEASAVETSVDKVTVNDTDRLMFPEDEKETNYPTFKVNRMEATAGGWKESNGNETNTLTLPEGMDIQGDILNGDTTNATLGEGGGERWSSQREIVNLTDSEAANIMKLIGENNTENVTTDVQNRWMRQGTSPIFRCGYNRWCGYRVKTKMRRGRG